MMPERQRPGMQQRSQFEHKNYLAPARTGVPQKWERLFFCLASYYATTLYENHESAVA